VLTPNVVAVACGLLLPLVDRHVDHQGRLPIPVSAAQTIFGALAGGMITFTGIVFSAVFVAAQIQTSSYSPRLAARLRRDPVVLAGLAFPTATAVYSLLALAAVGRQNATREDYVPAITVIFGLVLAGVTLAVFVALVQRAFDRIQIGGILRSLMRRPIACSTTSTRIAPPRRTLRRRPSSRDRSRRSCAPGRRGCCPRSTAARSCACRRRAARSSRCFRASASI
jgi:uncharacterized membrane protein